jgi:hypothetical protein
MWPAVLLAHLLLPAGELGPWLLRLLQQLLRVALGGECIGGEVHDLHSNLLATPRAQVHSCDMGVSPSR